VAEHVYTHERASYNFVGFGRVLLVGTRSTVGQKREVALLPDAGFLQATSGDCSGFAKVLKVGDTVSLLGFSDTVTTVADQRG